MAAKSLASTLDVVADPTLSEPAARQQLGREGSTRRFVVETELGSDEGSSPYPARSLGVPVFVMMPLDTVSNRIQASLSPPVFSY